MTPNERAELEANIEAHAGTYDKKEVPHPNLAELETLLKSAFPEFFNFAGLIEGLEQHAHPVDLAAPEPKPLRLPADIESTHGPEVSKQMTEAVATARLQMDAQMRSHIGITLVEIGVVNKAIALQTETIRANVLSNIKTPEDRARVERMCRQRIRLNGDKLEVYEE